MVWHKFLYPSTADSEQALIFTLRQEHFPYLAFNRNIQVKQIEILLKSNYSGDYYVVLETDGNEIMSEIKMVESPSFGNLKIATIEDAEEIDVLKQISIKFSHSEGGDYLSIETDPEEILDLFLVFHYCLGDVI